MAQNILHDGEYEIWRNDAWRVTNVVLEEIADPALAGPPYWIALTDLQYRGWLQHVCEKTWVDPAKFIEAYRKAAEVAGLEPDEAEIREVMSQREAEDAL
jgi:hypothetical protein